MKQAIDKDALLKALEEQLAYVKATPPKKAKQFYTDKSKHECFIAGFEIAIEFIRQEVTKS